jgi:hypothetical protein
MCTSICPIRFKPALATLLLTLLLTGCASDPQAEETATASATPVTPAIQKPAVTKTSPEQDDSAPSVLIRGKSSNAILNGMVKYRAKRGMKVVQRERNRLVLSKPIPDTDPPAEARMVFSIKPEKDGLRLSARILRVSKTPNQPARIDDITASLRDQLAQELARYAR